MTPTSGTALRLILSITGCGHRVDGFPTHGFDFVDFGVDSRTPRARREVRDVAFPSGSHVIADTETVDVAGPTTTLTPGHEYLLPVEPGAAQEVSQLLQGYPQRAPAAGSRGRPDRWGAVKRRA